MLQLKEIRKEYKTGDLEQVALNDVSLNLRDNEFVAILGPPAAPARPRCSTSSAAWTAMTAGDLIINGISTKEVHATRDWDYLPQPHHRFRVPEL